MSLGGPHNHHTGRLAVRVDVDARGRGVVTLADRHERLVLSAVPGGSVRRRPGSGSQPVITIANVAAAMSLSPERIDARRTVPVLAQVLAKANKAPPSTTSRVMPWATR